MRVENPSILRQVWYFVLHLRWHYQLFILSGGFLLGGFLSADLDPQSFITQFFNVHLLLFGGATAYNSYWDKDEGAIGGLLNPPKMHEWMWPASLLFQLVGFVIAIREGVLFAGVYLTSMLFFWLYSTPLARWKSHPIKSLVAIGVSTGSNSVLLGYLSAGNLIVGWPVWLASAGVTFMLLSLYPISQIYQLDEDRKRGDRTFAVRYGKRGVTRFFAGAFFIGLLFVSGSMIQLHFWLGILFGMIGMATGTVVWQSVRGLSSDAEDYSKVMLIKYGTSIGFVLFLILGLILKHTEIDGISSVAKLLLE